MLAGRQSCRFFVPEDIVVGIAVWFWDVPILWYSRILLRFIENVVTYPYTRGSGFLISANAHELESRRLGIHWHAATAMVLLPSTIQRGMEFGETF